MQRFFSTASLSILTAIAIVMYSSEQSPPLSQGLVITPPGNPLSGFLNQEQFERENQKSDKQNTTRPMDDSLGEEWSVGGKNDLLALAPYQFSNCDVGLLSHNLSLGQ